MEYQKKLLKLETLLTAVKEMVDILKREYVFGD